LSEIPFEKTRIVISTIPDEGSNRTLAEFLKSVNSEAIFIATAEQPRQALDLYESGVDYVIIPQHLGGDYVADMIKNYKIDKEKYKKIGKDHRQDLQKSKNNSTFN
jgi:Trk K+ transport system NAD-binding subunit